MSFSEAKLLLFLLESSFSLHFFLSHWALDSLLTLPGVPFLLKLYILYFSLLSLLLFIIDRNESNQWQHHDPGILRRLEIISAQVINPKLFNLAWGRFYFVLFLVFCFVLFCFVGQEQKATTFLHQKITSTVLGHLIMFFSSEIWLKLHSILECQTFTIIRAS